MANNPFPKDFLWGAATSPYQVEGSANSQWSAWEKAHAGMLAKAAGEKYSHLRAAGRFPPKSEYPDNYICGPGVEHDTRYIEDFNILNELNLRAFRFGIEWSLIEPKEGYFDEQQIEHYLVYIHELKKRGIEPIPTLWHWSEPIWFRNLGGFSKKKNIRHFVRFTEKIVETYGAELKYLITINEPNVYVSLAYLDKDFPLEGTSRMLALSTYYNLASAHKAAYKTVKNYYSHISVGLAANIADNIPKRPDKLTDRTAAKLSNYLWDWWFLDMVKGRLDFVGLNYYHTNYLRGFKLENPETPTNDLGWYMEPTGIERVLNFAWQRYGLPIIITENGLADSEDKYRTWWIRQTIQSMEKALTGGVGLFGYLHWSLLDNFEWKDGWWPKFGLVEVDRENGMTRRVRPSGKWYAEQIANLTNND